jgi:hypothetical protein
MATYYKYAERSAEDYVDWGAIGKTMSDTLLEEQKNREKMKADIDKASREFGEVLSNAPQGAHRGLNEYSQEFASNAQQYQLMQLRNLKAGKLSLKDYLVGRENLKQGANDAFDIIKKYNDKYSEYQQRLNDGISSGYETFLLGEIEGFGNLSNTSLYINPTDGKVSAGKRMLKDPSKTYDPDTNPYTAQMSDNPNDFRSLVDLNFALSAQIDKYDAQGAIANIANSFAKDYQVITEKGARGAYTKVSDITKLGEDGVQFKEALEQKILADFRTNPIHTISALKDYVAQIPVDEDGNFDKEGTLTTIEFTRNPKEANAHTILLKANPQQPEGGTDVMDEDAEGAQELLDYMMEQVGNSVMASLNKKIEISAGRAPQQAKGGGKDKLDKAATDFYRRMRERVFFDRELSDGTTERTIGRSPLFKFASLFGVPVTEEIIEEKGDDDKTIKVKVYQIGDLTLERDAGNTELMQAIESQISGTDINTAYRKRGGSNTMAIYSKQKN